jgi:hypothetical protein
MPDSGANISAASRVYRMTLRGSGIESTMRPPAGLASLDRRALRSACAKGRHPAGQNDIAHGALEAILTKKHRPMNRILCLPV